MKISIAMTTYNGGKYLYEQLQSFVTQTMQPDELVICDDASTDNTVSILNAFANTVPFDVKIFRNEHNLGYTGNFGKAMSLCTGDIIFLSDQDDAWLPEKIWQLTQHLEQNPTCMVVSCDLMICDADLNSTGKSQLQALIQNGGSADMFIWGCAMALRREFVHLALPIPEAAPAHDDWIVLLSSYLDARDMIDKPMHLYRKHDSNASNWIMGSPEKVSSVDMLKAYGMRSAVAGWEKEIAALNAASIRMTSKAPEIVDMGLADRVAPAIVRLVKRTHAIRKRITTVQKHRLVRWPFVLSMFARGDYRNFAGWKSVAKDILRP